LGGGGKRSFVVKYKEKTDFADIAHLHPWPWKAGVVPQLLRRKLSRRGVAGTAPALDTGHLPGDGDGLRPGQDISPNTCRTSLLLWQGHHTDSAGVPHLFIAARILII